MTATYQQQLHEEALARRARMWPKPQPVKTETLPAPSISYIPNVPPPQAKKPRRVPVPKPVKEVNPVFIVAMPPSPYLGHIMTLKDADRPPLRTILQAAAKIGDASIEEMCTKSRVPRIVAARHLYFFMARFYNGAPYSSIGFYCGGINHCTIIKAVSKVNADIFKWEYRIKAMKRKLKLPL
jgi:hypothetical protein